MRNSSAYVTAAALALLALAGCQSSGSSTNAQASSDPWWKFGYGSSKSAPSNNVASNAPLAPANPTLPSAVTSPGTPMNGAGTSGSFAGSPYLPPASSQNSAYPGTNSTGSIYGAGGAVAPGGGYGQNAFAASPARTATPTAYESPAYPSSGYPATSYPQTAYPGTASSYGAPGNSYGAPATGYPGAGNYATAARPAAMPGAAAAPQVGYYGSNYGQPAATPAANTYGAAPSGYGSAAPSGYGSAAQPNMAQPGMAQPGNAYGSTGYGAAATASAGYGAPAPAATELPAMAPRQAPIV